MTDIVDMLRQGSLTRDDYRWKAADELTHLTAEVERLRALADAVCWFDWSDNDGDAVQTIAALRAALYPPIPQEAPAHE